MDGSMKSRKRLRKKTRNAKGYFWFKVEPKINQNTGERFGSVRKLARLQRNPELFESVKEDVRRAFFCDGRRYFPYLFYFKNIDPERDLEFCILFHPIFGSFESLMELFNERLGQ